MHYRTKTYLAGDWTGDSDLIEEIMRWKEDPHEPFSFQDAHDITQARDSSLSCSIKSSLRERLNASRTFVLIVGDKTNSLTAGACFHCDSYRPEAGCLKNYSKDNRSYIQFECEYAAAHELRIIVIYNSLFINPEKCPEILRDKGIHLPGRLKYSNTQFVWNSLEIKRVLSGFQPTSRYSRPA